MTEEQKEHLVLKSRNGDQEAILKLYHQFEKLFNSSAKYKNLPGYTPSDFKQENIFDLMEAINTYDKSRGAKFMTYLCYVINHNHGKRKDALSRQKRKVVFAPTRSFDEPVTEDKTCLLEDVLECVNSTDTMNTIEEMASYWFFNRTEFEVIVLIFEGYTLAEISELLKITQKHLHNIRRNIKTKLDSRL